jgi:hypothetical protein
MILSIDTEKAFNKIQYPFRIKALKKLGIEGKFLNIIKTIYNKPEPHHTKWRTTETIPIKVRKRQHCLLFPLIFNIVLEFLARTVRQEQEIKGDSNREGGSQTIPIHRYHNLYLRDPKTSTKKLLEIINCFGKVAGHKITTEISSLPIHQQ